ncbi:MAG: energy-coupling factor transporter ATPase [Tissierellia bacterium]|nr:energy-coupling factor transporter ATPase [Tissierellia bacterium]
MDPIIQIEHLDYMYEGAPEGKKALDDLSIEVYPGEFVAVLGHNGSGKSTLAKLLNGLILPTNGEIRIAGMNTKDEERLWDIRRTCGMVFQNPDNQIIATVVEEDIAFGPENLGVPMPELKERVDRALAIVEMEEYRKHAPHLLSGGQKQRIAIAGILAMDPQVVIMDEPTAMLDPQGREEIIGTIATLNRTEKKTVLLITHYMDEVVEADRVIVLEEGRIALQGTPREVFSRVEEMKRLGLDVPQATEMAWELARQGIDLQADILTVEELVAQL